MKNKSVQVSIITPTHNSIKFISKTWDSIKNQTFQSWEWIVVDDYSNDGTKQWIENLSNLDKKVKYYELIGKKGPAHSRNYAIKKAKGRFIAFLDSDDLWHPKKLEYQISFMISNNYWFTYSNYDIIDKGGKYLKTFTPPIKTSYYRLLRSCDIGCLTAIYDAQYFGKSYMVPIPKRQDYNLWLDLLKKVDQAYCFNKSLGYYRLHSKSISRNKIKAIYWIWVVYYKYQNLGVVNSLKYIVIYSLNGFINKLMNRK